MGTSFPIRFIMVKIRTIETERLRLRKYAAEDAEAAFNELYSNDNVMRFSPTPTHSNISETREYIETVLKKYETHPDTAFNWHIELKSSGELIGQIGLGETGYNVDIKAVELGYDIGEKWRRQGYATEALAAVIKFFFEEVGVNRVWAFHDTENPNSGKVLQKCGLKYEGTLRQTHRNHLGDKRDIKLYGLLAEEYFNSSADQ